MLPAITVENLSKAYRIGLKEEIPDTFAAAVTGWLKAPLRNFGRLRRLDTFKTTSEAQPTKHDEQGITNKAQGANDEPSDIIWALKRVSFEVREGEVLGVIGRNGAGKTTLLKILSKITEPTSGRALLRGRVA